MYAYIILSYFYLIFYLNINGLMLFNVYANYLQAKVPAHDATHV